MAIILFLVLLALLLLSSLRLGIWFDALNMISSFLSGAVLFLKNSFNFAFVALMFVFFRAQDELLQVQKKDKNKHKK